MLKAQTIPVYGLDKKGATDTESRVTKLVRTPSFQALQEMNRAGVDVWTIGRSGVIPLDNLAMQQSGLAVSAMIIDASTDYDHAAIDWQREIAVVCRQLIPSEISVYYKAAHDLLVAAFAEMDAEGEADASGEVVSET